MNKANGNPISPHAIILFDGVCNLCAWTVQFILPRDRRGYFQFASLQSPLGQKILQAYGIRETAPDSVVLVEDGRVYFKSEAALRIAKHLDGIWSLARVLVIVPKPLRDWVYDWMAAHRYRIFGQRQTCLVNVPNAQERFLGNDVMSDSLIEPIGASI